jgi:3-deoxy-D-manno-octulosonic-acid transferase
MRLLYTLLLSVLTPLILLRLWWKGRVLPAYRQRIGERFAAVPPASVKVWLHAVSVGEVLAAAPLVQALCKQHGARQVWVTTTTPTGSAQVQRLFPEVCHSYAPYDLPWVVKRFLSRCQPQQVVIMETELWPNLFHVLKQQSIPLFVVNARLSPRSFRGYGRVSGFCRQVLSACTHVAAQSEADAQRFRALGARAVSHVGNLKLEVNIPAEQVRQGLADKPALAWIAASTHEGEEALALQVHQQVLKQFPRCLLIVVPRHPQRFEAVAQLIKDSGLPYLRRSQVLAGKPQTTVLLGDSLGEMWRYLAMSDVAFVGGSLVSVGGHNVLEPAALSLPVLFGPYMYNFLAARQWLLEAGAAEEINEHSLAAVLIDLLQQSDKRQDMGASGLHALQAHKGALSRILALLNHA